MDKTIIEKQYKMELEKSKYYQEKYSRCEKNFRDYEYFRQKYLYHRKLASVYFDMLQQLPFVFFIGVSQLNFI